MSFMLPIAEAAEGAGAKAAAEGAASMGEKDKSVKNETSGDMGRVEQMEVGRNEGQPEGRTGTPSLSVADVTGPVM